VAVSSVVWVSLRREGEGPKADDGEAVEVWPGRFTPSVTGRGVVEPSRARDVASRVEGAAILVTLRPEGSVVKEGEVVAELNSAAPRDRLVNQRIVERQAEAESKQARLVREVAEYAVKEYEESDRLQRRSAIDSKASFASAEVNQARDRREQARFARKRLEAASARRAGPATPADVAVNLILADQIDRADRAARKAESDLATVWAERDALAKDASPQAPRELQSDVTQTKADEERAQQRWEIERARTRVLQRQVADCTLPAPVSGLVEQVRVPGDDVAKVEEGATIAEGQVVFRVADPSDQMRVVVPVGEAVVDRLQPGRKARVEVAARPGAHLTGVVRSIGPGSVVVVDLDPHAVSLRAGMAARAEILLDEVEGVMEVPARAVYLSADGGRAFVAVRDRRAVAWREVTLGRANDRAVEVVAGLQPGERVVRDPSAGTGLDFLGKRPRGVDASRVQGQPAP
jgi:RND family efflux transporter MFP subunit